MTAPRGTMETSPVLDVPLAEPAPGPGCVECQRWARRRADARAEGDGARVSDCNVMLRRCIH